MKSKDAPGPDGAPETTESRETLRAGQGLATRPCSASEYKTMKDKPEPITVTPSWGNDKWSDPDAMPEITPSISDTPETDAAIMPFAQVKLNLPAEDFPLVPAHVAKRLEREKNEARKGLADLNRELGFELMDPSGTIWEHAKNLQRALDRAKRQLDEAQALAARYRMALESIVAVAMESPDHLLMHIIASDSPIRAVMEAGKPNA